MLNHNFLTYSVQIIIQILGEILYFPVWWYTVGFGRLVKGAWRFWRNQEQILGFSVWLKNLFVPMYGQRDFAGRLISFVIRLVQVIFRGVILLAWLAALLVLFLSWLALPLTLLFITAWQFK
ncbi:MAG: hypothetical protein WC453_03650 [Patescibacteria group bacterium]